MFFSGVNLMLDWMIKSSLFSIRFYLGANKLTVARVCVNSEALWCSRAEEGKLKRS